jgi:deoxyribodipyrimidine photolyase
MGRPYQEKFADIKWEVNEEHFNTWKEGKTGVPIVDAGMRQLNTMGTAASLIQRSEALNSDDVEPRLDA